MIYLLLFACVRPKGYCAWLWCCSYHITVSIHTKFTQVILNMYVELYSMMSEMVSVEMFDVDGNLLLPLPSWIDLTLSRCTTFSCFPYLPTLRLYLSCLFVWITIEECRRRFLFVMFFTVSIHLELQFVKWCHLKGSR